MSNEVGNKCRDFTRMSFKFVKKKKRLPANYIIMQVLYKNVMTKYHKNIKIELNKVCCFFHRKKTE